MRSLKDKHMRRLLMAVATLVPLVIMDCRTKLGDGLVLDHKGTVIFLVTLLAHGVIGATLVRQLSHVWFSRSKTRRIKHRAETDAWFAAIQAAHNPVPYRSRHSDDTQSPNSTQHRS